MEMEIMKKGALGKRATGIVAIAGALFAGSVFPAAAAQAPAPAKGKPRIDRITPRVAPATGGERVRVYGRRWPGRPAG